MVKHIIQNGHYALGTVANGPMQELLVAAFYSRLSGLSFMCQVFHGVPFATQVKRPDRCVTASLQVSEKGLFATVVISS